ncbi:alpha/beta fold hydrolase [Saccharopolyspora sp. K220]|uniref:alpha/beta fold hydrolase n=1 Tax=Saccharopolyspora soli TaxID=2926618 RepID=UPI001F56B3B2|nr:alpha/beta fold hydrolase [Saccharopolyspora soli]MCI2422250.1 alpha/beta fold hydrolase [Saccharopolyspora soli]
MSDSDGIVRFVDGPSGRIAYRRTGSGPPLVLLHPLALSGRVWDPVVDQLADHFDTIAPDARGHGQSGWDRAEFGVTELADDIVALLDGLGFPAAHLVGMSMGGSVAINVAGRHPGRVERLVLADTTAWYGADAVPTWTQRAEKVRTTGRPAQIPFQVDRWFTEHFRRTHPAEVNRVVGIFLATDSAAHAQASLALGRMDGRELLPSITAPTLAFAGEEDYATPPEMAVYAAEHVADGTALNLPGLRHLSLVERPALAGLVRAHLEGTGLPAGLPAASCGCAAGVRS